MADRFIASPFRKGAQGGIAVTEDVDRHLRDKVMAILFTAPGERVNRPSFGAGINRAVFENIDELTAGALEFRISQALRRDLEDEAIVDIVRLEWDDNGEVTVHLAFRRQSDRQTRTLEIVL
ncbi:MAG TPA: GPW/gp25 family protein [Haliangium sp.]|nr:GPW/gp25 family protein [Haliangium sp.]